MDKNGLYTLNQTGIDFLKANNCQIIMNIGESKIKTRPMFFSLEDFKNPKLIYIIPLSIIRNVGQKNRILGIISGSGISSNFYEIGVVDGKDQVFKISSVLLVTDTMLDEWKKNNRIYIVQNQQLIANVEKKLRVMINHYHANPEKSENNVIQLKIHLIKEMNEIKLAEKTEEVTEIKETRACKICSLKALDNNEDKVLQQNFIDLSHKNNENEHK